MITRALVSLFALLCLGQAPGFAGAPSFSYLNVDGLTSSGRVAPGTVTRWSDDGSVIVGDPGTGSPFGDIGYRAVLGAGAPAVSRFDDFTPLDLSADGSVLVGGRSINAFRKAGSTLTTLTPAGFFRASATSVSADGSVAAGTAEQFIAGNFGPLLPFRWTAGTGSVVFDLPEDTAIYYNSVTLAKDGASLFAVTVYAPPTIGVASSTYGLAHWDAAGTRSKIVPPAGYEFHSASPLGRSFPEFSLSYSGRAAILIRERPRLSPYPASAILLWTPQGATVLPLPKFFGHGEPWAGVLQSADGSVLVVWSPRSAVRYQNGVFTDLGPFTPRFVNADGSVILGVLNTKTHPAAWTAASGLVDITEKLGLQIDSPPVPPGRWSLASFGVRGTNLVFAANGNPLATPLDGRISVGELSLASLTAPEAFTGTLLTEGTKTKPSATYSETGGVRAVNLGGPPPAVFGPAPFGSATLRITASMEGVDVNSLNASSPVELLIGSLRIFKGTLNDDTSAGGFSPGDTSVEFANAGLKVQWTPLAVNFEVKRISILREFSTASGTLPIRLRFGTRTGLRMLQFNGSFTRASHDGGDGPSFFTSKFTSKGAFTPLKPAVTAKLPKDGTLFTNRHLELPVLTSKTPVEFWMRLNGGDWTYLGVGIVTPPPVLLADGANTVEMEVRDGLGNTTSILKRSYTYLPKAGSYTTLLSVAGEPRGYVTLLLTEDGAFTGKLNLDGKPSPLRGALDSAGHAALPISRGTKLEALTLTLDLRPGTDANALDATLTIPQPGAPALLATGTGGRAIWNAPLHPALLAGTPQERVPSDFAALLQPGAGAPAAVTGSGHFGLRLLKGSTLTARGKLADGTPFTASLPLDDSLTAPVFLRLAGGKIRLGGTLTFDFSQPATDLTGLLRWRRDPAGKGPFAAGWNFPLVVIGSRSGSFSNWPFLRFSGGGLAGFFGFSLHAFPADPLFSVKPLTWVEYAFNGYKGTVKDPATGKAYPFEFVQLSKNGQAGGFFITPAGGGAVTLTGLIGTTDGPAELARFNSPTALALDSGDNVYVADRGSHTIRKITPDGVVSTFAGRALTRGITDGMGDSARFHFPEAIAVDANDQVFVADTSNYTIRKITLDGTVTTFAGSAGQPGSTDATGTNARFQSIRSLAFSGVDLFVGSDAGLRKVTPGAGVTTINTNAFVVSIAPADAKGDLFIGNNRLQKLDTATATVTNLAGNPSAGGTQDGRGEAARFGGSIGGLAADAAGNVFVADTYSHTIRKVAPDGTVLTFAGKGGVPGKRDGLGSAARFRSPRGLAFDAAGNLYVVDTENHAIRKITPAGEVSTFAGPR